MGIITWDDEEEDEGTVLNGWYVSLFAPYGDEGWVVRVAVSEEAADRDELLINRELPASMTLAEVQHRAECSVVWLQELATV
jgi:hypothetical protein